MPENNLKMMTSSLPVPIRPPMRTSPSISTTAGVNSSATEVRLKMQLDDCERRRKNVVIHSQKVTRENEALQKKYKQTMSENEQMKKAHQRTKEELAQLQRVSEAVYKEYEKLLQRFNVETGAMHQAMQKASDWYKQNRALKRQSAMLVQKVLQVSPQSISELDESSATESTDKDGEELDDLRRSVKALSSEVATLQVELNTVRLEEFEAQEQLMEASTKLESEKLARIRAEEELKELSSRTCTLERLVSLEAEELATLREKCEHEKLTATEMRKEADKAKRERNVLAHQSTLLLADIVGDERVQMLLQDIENLKTKLEKETSKHSIQIQELQNKIFELESENRIEALEEKLKLAETELEIELQKGERAEAKIQQLETKVSELQDGKTPPNAPPAPPMPPPPPPAPPLPSNPMTEIVTMLGLQNTTTPIGKTATLRKTPSIQGSAIDEIIGQIKGGRFQLKATERRKGKQEEKPAAVQEMLQILGTMKRGAKQKAPPSS